MEKLEQKLTVDDLIMEYILYIIKNGYDSQFSATQFMVFLHFFENQMEVEDVLYGKKQLFTRFFEREREYTSHLDMEYNRNLKDYLIQANYQLNASDCDSLTTNFMDSSDVEKIRKLIAQFWEKVQKRKINTSIFIKKENLLIGKYTASEMIMNALTKNLGLDYEKLVSDELFELQALEPLEELLPDFYDEISKRIAILYQCDQNLKINNDENRYLANYHYHLLKDGYGGIFERLSVRDLAKLEIDLNQKSFISREQKAEQEIINQTEIGNDKAKTFSKILDNHISRRTYE